MKRKIQEYSENIRGMAESQVLEGLITLEEATQKLKEKEVSAAIIYSMEIKALDMN